MQSHLTDIQIITTTANDHETGAWLSKLLVNKMRGELMLSVELMDESSSNRIWSSSVLYESTTTTTPSQQLFMLFGGLGEPRPSLSIFDLKQNKWITNPMSTDQLIPDYPRWGVSTALHRGKVYLIAGFDNQNQYNDTMTYDIESKEFHTISQSHIPHSAFSTATSVGSKILFFGGCVCNAGPYQYFNSMFLFDTVKHTWKSVQTFNEIPAPVSQHTMLRVKNWMVLIGGYNGKWIKNDIYTLCLDTGEWVKRVASGSVPKPVKLMPKNYRIYPARHSAAVIYTSNRKTLILVYGICNTNTFKILQVTHNDDDQSLLFKWMDLSTQEEVKVIGHTMSVQRYGYPSGQAWLYGANESRTHGKLYRLIVSNMI